MCKKAGSFFFNIGVAVDQLGNTLAGGYADNTISARVGSFAHEHSPNKSGPLTRWYWIMMQTIINTTFYPVDGFGHCHKAYHKEAGNGFKDGSDIMRFILSLTIILSCIPIIAVLYTLWTFRIVRPREQDLAEIAEKGFNKMDRMIISGMEITKEENTLPQELLDKSRETEKALSELVKTIERKVVN